MSSISSYVKDESSGGLSGVLLFSLPFGGILNIKYIPHPRVYHKNIFLLKAVEMQNDVPFSNLDGFLDQFMKSFFPYITK